MQSVDKRKRVSYQHPDGELVIKYGMQYLEGNSLPYFSITGETKHTAGCIHDEIAKYAPSLAPLIPWHLASQNGLPMYYIENSIFFLQEAFGLGYPKKPESFESFQTACIWNVSTLEQSERWMGVERLLTDASILAPKSYWADNAIERAKEWLQARAPTVQAAFTETMERFKVEMIVCT